MDYVDNGPCLGDILAHVLKEKTGMRVDVQLREPVGEPSYEWQVVDEFGWIQCRSEFRKDCAEFLMWDANKDMAFTLKRVRVESRGKLTKEAWSAVDLVVYRYGRDQKINCIKAVRGIFGLGLRESKDLVEDYLNDL